MKEFNFEKYVGIPFNDKGEDLSGANCWTLARLIYKEEFGINLPSFSNKYSLNDEAGIAELIAQYKEGWESVDTPQAGDLVLFRILGHESHVGVMIDAKRFVDIRENRDSVVDAIDAPAIRKRVVGFFRYNEQKSVVLNAVPHPLKTQRFTLDIPLGCNIRGIVDIIHNEYKLHEEYEPRMHVLLNGIVIPEEQWDVTFPKETDAVEYRVVPGKKAIAFIAIIAIAIVAPYLATQALQFAATAGMTITATMGAVIYYGTMAAVNLLGNALVSRIAPVRGPSTPAEPGSTERQLMVTGGANRTNPYGAIPVVLGKVRMTPVLASNTYLTYENGRDSYLSMLLCWGYGPLHIDRGSFKIGDIPLFNYAGVTEGTDDRISELSPENLAYFNSIYGNDVDQVQVNLDLTCDGNPEIVSGAVPINYFSQYIGAGDSGSTNNFVGASLNGRPVGQSATITITFPNNFDAFTQAMLVKGSSLTINSFTKVNPRVYTVGVTVTGTAEGSLLFASQKVLAVNYTLNSTGGTPNMAGAYANTVAPGPWLQTSSLQTGNYEAKIALHYPQGLRRIIVKGDGSGKSQAVSITFRIEQSTDGSTWTHLYTHIISGNNKDAFTEVLNFSTSAPYIRIRRETGDNTEDNDNYRYYHQSTLLSVAYVSNQRPVTDPVGVKLAKTAIKIKATDQLSGNLEGFNAVVQTWCKTWNGSSWVMGVSNNPADLMRYVLEHPGNPRRVTSDNQLDLPALQAFADYCWSKGFQYNSILATQRSVLDVVRDICAAGRASPSLKDGKWTVVIDEAKPVVQHFTPHNSWGFEGSKALPRYPHGLRVNFFDEDKNYQEVETIVYDAGYSPANATVFESINLPGITKSSLVTDHTKWHFAQAKLRPEVYTLNTDIEYLVCNRGDRVKVLHDVPMWGIGSARVKNTRINLIRDSEQFNLWFDNGGVPVTSNAAIAPDGTMTADALTTAGTRYQFANIQVDALTTFSFYIKPADPNLTQFIYQDGTTAALNVVIVPATGQVVANSGNYVSAFSTPVGNGWYRLGVTFYAPFTGNRAFHIYNSRVETNYYWGAQLESYSRDNLLSFGSEFDNSYWFKANTTIVTNSAQSPDNSNTADKLIETTAEGSHYVAIPYSVFEADKVYKLTVYAKAAERSWCILGLANEASSKWAWFNLSNGTMGTVGNQIVSANVLPSGNGWYKCEIVVRTSVANPFPAIFVTAVDGGAFYTGNASSGIYIWGARLEELTYLPEGPTDYIQSTSLPGTAIELDEDVPMQAGVSYAARIRTDNGNSFQLRTKPVLADGYYSMLEVGTFTSGFTPLGSFNLVDGSNTGTLKPSDLVLFGELNQEAQDLTVISIEPAENKSARLTLVDYGVTDTYNIFTDYLTYTSAFVFESQITQPAKLQLNSFGDSVPTITGFVSDESVMEQISAGVFQYNMNVGYYNPYQLPVGTTVVEAQYDLASATNTTGSKYVRSDFQTSNVNIKGVTEGVTYKVRLRYISDLGVVGKWSEYSTHTVTGKSNPPASVQAVVVNADKASGNLTVLWDKNLEIDVDKYEIRKVNAGWGTENSDLLYLGDATTAVVPFSSSFTYYIKAVDFFGNYSLVATPVTYNSVPVVAPSNLRFSFSTIALTNVLCAFRWDQVSNSEFNIAYYEFQYDGITEKVQSTAFDVQSFWLGYKTFTVRAVDIHEQRSAPSAIIVEKQAPNAVTDVRTQVIDNTVMMYWSLPSITTLPIDHIMIKRGSSWDSPDFVIGQKKGEFTTNIENVGGDYTYWLAAVDTSGAESTPVSIGAIVSEPPDFIFYGEFISDLSGTLVNAKYNEGKVTAPLNTSETWQGHFTARSWTTPQAQITAGYPYYSQPNLSPASYTEVFDFGTILASSRIQVNYGGSIVVNGITTICTISTSDDGVDYTNYEGVTSIYGTAFRYVKVKIDIIAATDKGLYNLEQLSVKLDSKLITDAGRATLVSTDTGGTVVNFNKSFIDVQSLTLSAGGTIAATPVYNFKDSVGSGTYNVVSNLCTVTKTAHGLIAGQNVELFVSSGNGVSNVYTITAATANTFTVSMTVGNTSGNSLIYPQSFTVYLFNASGARVSGSISWSVRGY